MTDCRFRRPRRIRGAVIGDMRYGDEGSQIVAAQPHAYLDCFQCHDEIILGRTDNGAWVLICESCQRVADVRRVA